MKNLLPKLKTPALISFLLVLPFTLLEWGQQAGFPCGLDGVMKFQA